MNDVIQIEGPSFSESKHVITAKDCMCEDKFEQYMKEERRYLYERINLLRLFKPGNIGFRDVFFRYSFTVMGFENMVEHCSYNQTRNFIDSRKFTLSEEEIVSCNQWLNDYCNAPYTLLKESIDEFSWGLEQDDTPTGFEQHITALEMTLLPQNQTGKKQMLANRISAMLGNSPAEIQQLYQKVMNFYRFRSESLHEGNDSNITDTELHDLENITREVLKKCLIRCKIEYDLDSSITWNEIKNQIMNDIKASESIVKQKDAYTTESYRVFEQALTGAKEVAADKKATKDEVENALKVLTNAKAGLEKKATTKPATVKKTTAEKKVVVAKASAKLKSGKKKVTVKIKKASVSGYQIKYASNKNFKKAKTRNTRKTIYTIKSLRSKKKCYVKVRAYKVVKGKKIYGSYSKVLKVTVK